MCAKYLLTHYIFIDFHMTIVILVRKHLFWYDYFNNFVITFSSDIFINLSRDILRYNYRCSNVKMVKIFISNKYDIKNRIKLKHAMFAIEILQYSFNNKYTNNSSRIFNYNSSIWNHKYGTLLQTIVFGHFQNRSLWIFHSILYRTFCNL